MITGAETKQEPAWDDIDRVMVETHLINEEDRHTCGEYLSDTLDDDHGYRFNIVGECGRCRSEVRWRETQAKVDEYLLKLPKHNPKYPTPEARIVSTERIPLPPQEV